MNLFHRLPAALCGAGVLLSVNVCAADAPDDVVVTAARLAEPVSDVIGAVSVITRADIERRQARSVQDLLRGETGIDITNNGGLGKISSMFVRGADADQVLVLVDGIRMGSATAGTTRIEYLPVDQIERIEIVRGPRSSLYGADAIGGVIQIFTRKAQGPSVAIGSGSHDTQNASASLGLANDNAWLNASANYMSSAGFNSCRASFAGGCFTDEPDADGFRNASGSLRAGYRWGEKADIEASALYATGRTEYDGDWSNVTDFTEAAYSVKARVAPTAAWQLTAIAGVSQDDSADFKDSAATPRGHIDTERRNASLQSDWIVSDGHVLTFGADYLDDRIDSDTPYDATERDNTGIFAQYKGSFGTHEILLSARNDDNEQFGNHTTGNVGWKWALADAFALHAGWGSAFHAPSFNDLYYPGFSNPQLEPETSDSYEVGVGGTAARIVWSLNAFETRIDNLIAYDSATFMPQNIDQARIRGTELEAGTQVGHWSFAGNYTYLDPRNRGAGPYHDNLLPRRSRQSGRIDIRYATDLFSLGTTINAAGSRQDDLANTTKLDSYAVVDLVGEVRVGADWTVQGRIANAFDTDYETAAYYYQDGRSYFVTVQYRPAAH